MSRSPPPYHLVVARNVLEPEVVKFLVSNAPEPAVPETRLVVAFSRYKIERMFEDTKGELGMDHFEVRHWRSLQRHLILSCVNHLFLAEFHEEHRGKNPGLTVAQVRTATACPAPVWRRKGPCSRQRAEAISRRLLTTQQRNTLAARSHRKRTVRLLHARGVFLKNLRMCHWPNL